MLGIAKYREKDANQYDYEGLVASVKDVLLKSMRINAKKIK
ncbi:hypothetical protein FACS1894166_02840 [Bacilli bacterium]|nr:hypothetical protein FACS1894166_02840 [Bacilli bacterium]